MVLFDVCVEQRLLLMITVEIDAFTENEACEIAQEQADAGDYDEEFLEVLSGEVGIVSEEIEVLDARLVNEVAPGENYDYSQATPQAKLNMVINNPAAFGFFEEETEYIVTFEKAE